MMRGILVVLALALGGCAFNLAAASSGFVGCAADDITISDDTDNIGSRTWTAECNGRNFRCSAVAVGLKGSQVSCAEQVATRSSVNAPSPPTPAVSEAKPVTPKGAAGFLFGNTVEQASEACTASGHEWKAGAVDHYSCSGTPNTIGYPAVATVRFCDAKLCAIALQVDATREWLSAYAKISETLTNKYGEAVHHAGELRTDCQSEPEFESCVMTGGLSLERAWKWDAWNHASLVLTAGPQAPRLDLVYVHKSDAPAAL